jgi:hypothetical protein
MWIATRTTQATTRAKLPKPSRLCTQTPHPSHLHGDERARGRGRSRAGGVEAVSAPCLDVSRVSEVMPGPSCPCVSDPPVLSRLASVLRWSFSVRVSWFARVSCPRLRFKERQLRCKSFRVRFARVCCPRLRSEYSYS